MLGFWSCSTQKNTATNRALQNLSAKYNYVYNANVLLETYQENLRETHQDNFDAILPVYIAPEAVGFASTENNVGAELVEINKKAQAIIGDKNLSNYVDEAYIFLGKTNFYKGNYFTAIEFFDYLIRAYKKDKTITLTALNWKSRSLMQLDDYTAAAKALDTLTRTLDSVKTQKAEPLATLAQLNIYNKNYKKAIFFLEKAIKQTGVIESRTRWPFILGQLYEYDKDYNASLKYYTMVENSNAPFEMYFNAKLSKIRIYALQKDQSTNRKKQLLALLKDDKNADYTDKIYYEVAQDEEDNKLFPLAIKYYKLSVAKSTTNVYQKGVSYLKIADLNFKTLRNYANAKLYYDSAAATLPKSFINYESIAKKAQNLEYLTTRLSLIAEQDTLQLLAKLPIQERERKIEAMFAVKDTTTTLKKSKTKLDKEKTNSTFYFANTSALAQGLTDFKRRWGNRALEDNWRQSIKLGGQTTQQVENLAVKNEVDRVQNNNARSDSIKVYTEKLPLTSEKLSKSNQLLIDAYFEIANFYQQELNDQEEAVKIYAILLDRFPNNNHLDAIYYSLYLDFLTVDKEKSNAYKNLIFEKYPTSIFAKIILDPNFSAKQNTLEAQLILVYNSVFAKYEQKEFEAVIEQVKQTEQLYATNNLKAQFDYLKAIAIGRTNNVDALNAAFNQIISNYPDDKLIAPLVKDHLAYISANLNTFKARKIALVDFDPTEPRFIEQKENIVGNLQPQEKKSIATSPAAVAAVKAEEKPTPASVLPATAKTEAVKTDAQPNSTTPQTNKTMVADQLFSKAEAGVYYYMVAISEVSTSVSSSRFGIGQFNRGNYTGLALSHQLLELEEDQLIYVGDFETLNDVKSYSIAINEQLSRIMKIPAQAYRTFYISKENLAKIKDRSTLNRYIEFFKTNY